MTVTFNCPYCRRALVAHDELGVRQRKCLGCGRMVPVPEPQGATAPDAARPSAPASAGSMSSPADIEAVVEFLAERHHGPEQRKMAGGSRWGLFVMTPAEIVEFARRYDGHFDCHSAEATDPHGTAIHVYFYPKGKEHGCIHAVGLSVLHNARTWLQQHPLTKPRDLRIEPSPMDGRSVQINFIGAARKDLARPQTPPADAETLERTCRERIYTLGWDRAELDTVFHGAPQQTVSDATHNEAPQAGPAPCVVHAKEQALLQRIFECNTGGRQLGDVQGGVHATLATSSASRIFGAEVADLLERHTDEDLCAAFQSLDMAGIPVNDHCTKYYSKPEGPDPRLVGGDPRLVTLVYGLAALSEARRARPARVLVDKLVPKFRDKARHAAVSDQADEWHVGKWAATYFTAASLIFMKQGIGRPDWALALLDAVVADYPRAEETLYWRAMAACRLWLGDRKDLVQTREARRRVRDFLDSEAAASADPRRVAALRGYLGKLEAV